MKRRFIVSAILLAITTAVFGADAPSRPPFDTCKWRKISDGTLGLEVWVQRCTEFNSEFVVQGQKLIMNYHGKAYDAIESFDLLPGESIEKGLRRIYDSRTDRKIASRCVLVPYDGQTPTPRPRVKRYSFVPDEALRKELDAKAEEGIPEPPCGDLGDQPEFVQYFETQPASGSRKVLLVVWGQDTPHFDEDTLRLLPASTH